MYGTTRCQIVRVGVVTVCAAVLLPGAGAAPGSDPSREVFAAEATQDGASVSPNAGLTPIAELGGAAVEEAGGSAGEPASRAAGEECDDVGLYDQVFATQQAMRGNIFDVAETRTMVRFAMELDIPSGQPVDLYFVLYEKPLGGSFCHTIPFQQKVVTGRGRDFYWSDPFSAELSPTLTYLAGVAWEDFIAFGLQSRSLPIEYAMGTIFFSTGKNQIVLPDELQTDCITGLPNVNSEVYSMRLCFAPLPGACCLPDNTCVMTADAVVCEDPGGAFQGVFTAPSVSCVEAACPLEDGRCCIPPDACAVLNQFECLYEQGGDRWFPLETCAQYNDCFDAEGACCLYDGSCVSTTEADCQYNLEGVYLGDFKSCSEVTCDANGACCIPAGGCIEVTEQVCSQTQDAVFHGAGTHCQDLPNFPLDPCDGTLGACCFFDGSCQDSTTQYECEVTLTTLLGDTAGVWHEGTTCQAAQCPALGGCCESQGGTCTDTVLDNCNTAGLTWYEGVPCQYDPCSASGQVGACCFLGECSILNIFDCEQQLGGVLTDVGSNAFRACSYIGACTDDLGACCLADGGCVLDTEDPFNPGDCANTNGAFMGVGEVCTPYTCLTGSCCLPDDSCNDLRRDQCLNSSGSPGIPGSTCPPPPNPCQGACCYNQLCFDLTEDECATLPGGGGAFQGIGTVCTPDGCDQGACCSVSLSGGCGEITRSACEAFADGRFLIGETCGPDTCDPVGACCAAGGGCQVLTQADCEASAGSYQGDFSTCETGTCDLGACCPGDGSACVDATSAECDGLNGTFTAGTNCSTSGFLCEVPCCLPDGSCIDLLPLDCTTAGVAGPAGETCATTTACDPGACCLSGIVCLEVNAAECAGFPGVFSGAGSDCNSDGVCDIGACCLVGGGCEDDNGNGVSQYACTNGFGGMFVDGGDCTIPDLCDVCFGPPDGDFDEDGDVDWFDFAEFTSCLDAGGPRTPPDQCLCAFDFDDNGTVDLFDWAEFLLRFDPNDCAPGDYDDNGLVDLADFTAFSDCLAGVDATPAPVSSDLNMCLCVFDDNDDGDIDLADFAAFQAAFGS